MGTLTGSTPSLPDHCAHKLPTSCRLTATKHCCACQDKRPHAPTYSTYVDGVGMVMRGTRWQRYCWFCKEFWATRVAATEPRIDPRETQVPEVPDQTAFLERWFDYHRGYKIIRNEQNNSEERISMTPEKPWLEVSPGHLPLMSEDERRMALQQEHSSISVHQTEHVSLDNTLDELMEAATGEQQNRQRYLQDRSNHVQQPLAPLHQDQPPLPHEPGRPPRDIQLIDASIRQIDIRLASLEATRQETENTVQSIEGELRQVRDTRAQLLRDRRTAQNMTRVFGTREEIQRQGADYVSPLTTMFTRAYERYRVAEEVRAEERASATNTERHRHLVETLFSQRRFPFQAARDAQEDVRREEARPKTLDDNQDERPAPRTESEMTIKLICKICLQQTADTAVLPCGHLVMCAFCADVWAPARKEDHTQPVGRVNCPLCRKLIKKRVRIYTS